MYFVYILESQKDGLNYVGYSSDVQRRLQEHNQGKVGITKNRRPFKLIYFEGYLNQQDATAREKFYKTGWGKNTFKQDISQLQPDESKGWLAQLARALQ